MKRYNRSPFKPKTRGEYRIENKANEATIYLYDEISFWGVSAEQFIKDLNALDASTIHLRINSPGGAVFDGTAIYNAIKQHKAHVVTHIDGLAASIASIIALAGDEVMIAENAYMMIHEAWGIVIGYAEDMRKEADLLDKLTGTIANTYMAKTGKELDEIKEMMKAETWLTGQEALDAGFVDAVEEDGKEENKAQPTLFDLTVFNNVPDALKETEKTIPSKAELETVLRHAGCSQRAAKAILSEGYPGEDLQRDAVDPPQRDAENHLEPNAPEPQRDAAPPKQKVRNWVEDLLVRAELAAPSMN